MASRGSRDSQASAQGGDALTARRPNKGQGKEEDNGDYRNEGGSGEGGKTA